MPTLPPRNLPFSPPTNQSPQNATPASSSKRRIASSSSNVTTPSKERSFDGTGILPRQEETTFHRKMRNLLLDHSRATEKWEDITSCEGAKTIAAIAGLSASLDEVLAKRREKEEEGSDLPSVLHLNKDEVEARRMDEMAMLLKGLQAETENLMEDMLKIGKAVSKLESLSEAAEILLVEATRARGPEFAFEEGLWVTWSMGRFVDTLQLLTSRYVLQTEHLHCLNRHLLQDTCAPGLNANKKEGRTLTTKKKDEEEESSEDDEDDDDRGKEVRKLRARTRERVLEEWQKLAFLNEEKSGVSASWFDDVCEVEVGRWTEG
ncbi:hypothetical protein CBS101457_001103 [Exobasidium rhododendri]|nr:hypothetical protein CBS101457_001103 [Exobasidium rhododendri]